MPSQAKAEKDGRLVLEIMELRSYAQAKALVDRADSQTEGYTLPRTPLIELVTDIEGELAQERLERRRQGVD